LPFDCLLKRFHAGKVVLDAHLVEALHNIGVHLDVQVLGAVHKQRLINQIPQEILALVRVLRLQLRF
jgi:hypothetical protein